MGIEKDALIKNRGEPDKSYQLSIKLNTMQQLLNQSSRKAELVNEQLEGLLHELFCDEKDSVLTKLDSMPLQVKADILRIYKDELKQRVCSFFTNLCSFAKEHESQSKYKASSI